MKKFEILDPGQNAIRCQLCGWIWRKRNVKKPIVCPKCRKVLNGPGSGSLSRGRAPKIRIPAGPGMKTFNPWSGGLVRQMQRARKKNPRLVTLPGTGGLWCYWPSRALV